MIQPLKKGQSAQIRASNQAQVPATVEGILAKIKQCGA